MWLIWLANLGPLVQTTSMRECPRSFLALAPLLFGLGFGCEATVDGYVPSATGGTGSGGVDAGGSSSLAGSAPLPPGTEKSILLPARIRRLTTSEYQGSVSALLGGSADGIAADFVPDSRQSGFTVNEAQRVDPVFARQLAGAASTLAADVGARAGELAPCGDKASGAEACASTFIKTFGERAYRRVLGADEVEQLLGVFRVGADGGTYEEGIELTARAMLQSAAFLYLTEIGDGPAANVKLTAEELASSISYLLQGRPPSTALLAAARAGQLDTPEGRTAALADPNLKLFGDDRLRVVRFVREWLGIDRITQTAKDSNVYPDFAKYKNSIDRETSEFVLALLSQKGGSLRQLIAGDWTMADPLLAELYGVQPPSGGMGLVNVPKRLGMLNQAAFLSVFAHAHETAPVLRGVRVLRRVACIPVADPVDLSAAVVPPAPDPTKTTRERFAVHSASAACAGCHKSIDSFGFSFEGFDGMGRVQTTETEAKKPIDTKVTVAGTDFDGDFADSNALALAMSTSAQVRECFARHVYRGLAGTSVPDLSQSEDDFVKYWSEKALTGQGADLDTDLLSTLGAFITYPGFAYRRGQ